MTRLFYRSTSLFLLGLLLADAATTSVWVSAHGIGGEENVISAAVIGWSGLLGLWVLKAGIGLGIAWLVWDRKFRVTTAAVLLAEVAIMTWVVASNLAVIRA